jgi:hypothetical protein
MQNGVASNRIATPANVTFVAGSTLNVAAQGVKAGHYTIVAASPAPLGP